MKIILIFLMLCATVPAFADTVADLTAIARQSVEIVEQHGGQVLMIVASPEADPDLVAALKAVRKVVVPHVVPKSGRYTLPKGYLVVRSIEIEQHVAHFDGVFGPGALSGTMGADTDLDCGLRYGIVFMLIDGKWVNGPYRSQQCSVD